MDRETIELRAQNVQSGLRDVSDLRVSATIPISRQIGLAAQLHHRRSRMSIASKAPLLIACRRTREGPPRSSDE